MQLPAQLADVGDAERADLGAGDAQRLPGAEGEGVVRQSGVADRAEYIARAGPHQREHAKIAGDVAQPGVHAVRDIALDPREVVGREAGAGDDVVGVVRDPGHGEVAFDAAAGVAHLGVDQAARRPGHVVGADPGERSRGVAPFEHELGKRGGVEQGHRLARRPVLGADVVEPVVAAHGVVVAWLRATWCEPVGALPTQLGAETGALGLEALIER